MLSAAKLTFKLTLKESHVTPKIHLADIHRVSKKNWTAQTYFCQNFVKFTPIVKIFGAKIAE